MHVSDSLLLASVLLPAHQDFFRVIAKEKFEREFGGTPPLLTIFTPSGALYRLTTVLPLEIARNTVIPIPFIVDTGAPNFIYLSTGAVNALREVVVIEDITSANAAFRLPGKMYRGDTSVDKPCASVLPPRYEIGDPRLNLLGLTGVWQLKIAIIPL